MKREFSHRSIDTWHEWFTIYGAVMAIEQERAKKKRLNTPDNRRENRCETL